MLAEAFEVQRGGVAFVLREAVIGEFLVEVEHESIAGDLGDDTRGGDGKAERVAVDDRGLFNGKRTNGQAVDQDVIGFAGQLRGGGAHRLVRRAKDVQLIDFAMVHDSDGPMHVGARKEFVVEALPLKVAEFF